ncbi:Outer membrane protein TolC [Chitinophaga sp. YR573]|uniref:TolC family protein n=1 Tax=Chitinophaga sp. YR573 TaxID=1881040 RepID=UPI0008CC10FE|nr:TolC family protein [Chitinophaga sp. YR573]SEW46552.1 Outer membrane protein TolC [Chitinophaga sp. YR573]
MSTNIINKLSFTMLLLISSAMAALGQENVLDRYIKEAFEHNQGLQQRNFQLEKSLLALKEAKALFYPQVGVAGSYTKAGGGRTIDIPVGDMLNSVYSTLNTLTNSQKFPQLPNQSVLLNPDNYYDLHVRTSLPLINTEIWYAQKIRKEAITLQQATVNVYKRSLVKDIKTAYYQYYQAVKAVEIYNTALAQVQENIRVNKSFLDNGVRNNTSLTRAQAEQQKIETSITEAQNKQQNAQAYFNFLLNQPFMTPITLDSTVFTPALAGISEAKGSLEAGSSISSREELLQLDQQKKIADLQYKLSSSYLIPKLSTFLDLGSQAYNWNVDNKSRYYMWGVNLQWDLFAGGQRKYKAKQAASDIQVIQASYNETNNALQLEVNTAQNNYHTAAASFTNAQTQLQFSEKYYNDQLKVYKAGQLLYIELLDAQNQLTSARLQLSVAFAQVQTALAEIERTQATYKL